MTSDTRSETLQQRLTDTAAAHHDAFAATGGADPRWATWYAAHLLDHGVAELIGRSPSASDLAAELSQLDEAHRRTASDEDWSTFYARGLREGATGEVMALYHYDSCPFCIRVRRVIDQLGIEVELRNIHRDETHYEALLQARGRPTVPVLRTISADEDRWLPESRDIIAYLESRFS